MTAVILQARLDSTRLPRKALLDLAGKPVIVRVMENLRRVKADRWILACDRASEDILAPLAKEAGFECIGGPKEDVLERFCIVIRKTGVSTVLRATGDNPYLFADAANESLRRFRELRDGPERADYFTFSGLPHGSGIEVFSARKLLEAAVLTDSPFDHEHVGPSLYNHPDRFVSVRESTPPVWYHPDVRTTIDTREDYDRACRIAAALARKKIPLPASSSDILAAWRYITYPILFIPANLPGQGTGHSRRIESLVERLSDERLCIVCPSSSIGTGLPESAALVVLDGFRTSASDMARFRAVGPVVALDEGGSGRASADYLLDIIPGSSLNGEKPNNYDVSLLPLPVNRKKKPSDGIRSVLVLAGGENAAELALPVARFIAGMDLEVTVIDPSAKGISKADNGLTVSGRIEGLRENLCHFDLVVTHFGFTAFEALAAGCRVILFSPTNYHYRLAVKSGFSAIPPGIGHIDRIGKIIRKGILVPGIITPEIGRSELSAEIKRLSLGEASSCPLCGESTRMKPVARYPDRTVARCAECGMLYLRFRVAKPKVYARSYFFDEYRAQYGKTYIEDFESIKAQGAVRMARIETVFEKYFKCPDGLEKNILDVGCAYGPFLAAARDALWSPYGTDISGDAVAYVRDTLGIPAWTASFPASDPENRMAERRYAAVTFWYVIEHFRDLSPVLDRARKLLVPGGILAFSTPSASGVSGRFNRSSFFKVSPDDHYTIWDPRTVKKQLARYGFTVVKIVSTGHHPERFPFMKKRGKGSILLKPCSLASRIFRLGDTFEVYAIKNGTLEDAE